MLVSQDSSVLQPACAAFYSIGPAAQLGMSSTPWPPPTPPLTASVTRGAPLPGTPPCPPFHASLLTPSTPPPVPPPPPLPHPPEPSPPTQFQHPPPSVCLLIYLNSINSRFYKKGRRVTRSVRAASLVTIWSNTYNFDSQLPDLPYFYHFQKL